MSQQKLIVTNFKLGTEPNKRNTLFVPF